MSEGPRLACAASADVAFSVGEHAQLGFRAEAATLGGAHDTRVDVVIREVRYAGYYWDVTCNAYGGTVLWVRVPVPSDRSPPKGPSWVSWPDEQNLLLRADG